MEQLQEHLYYDVLKEITNREVPDDIFTIGSPFSIRGHGSDGINGDRHFYGVGHRRMPVSAYNQEKSHFFSEHGMQSFPEYNTILQYAPDNTTHNITSELMMSHQRGGVEANKVIESYIESEYGHPNNFQQFIYSSQLLQGDAMRTAIEAHRRDMPNCWGSLLWQHDDCWPVASWATRDYFGNWKAAHYMVRHAFEPLICSAITKGDTLQVYAVSDLHKKLRGNLDINVYNLDGSNISGNKRINYSVNINANTSTLLCELPIDAVLNGKQREDIVLHMTLAASGNTYETNVFLCLPKNLHLCAAEPKIEVTQAEGGCIVTLKADKFIRGLCLEIENANAKDIRWSNNYIDLLPGIPAQVFISTALSDKDVKRRIKLHSLCELSH